MQDFPLLTRFNAWVNRRLYDSVALLPETDYRAERGVFFGSVHRTLNHLLVVDRLWTRRIAGVEHGIASLRQELCTDFADLRAARESEDARMIELVDGLDAAALDSWRSYRVVLGAGFERTRVRGILLTMFNHQTHHRGQVHALLTQSGIEPPALDVIFFLEEAGIGALPAEGPA